MKKYVYIIVLIWALLAGGITAYNENPVSYTHLTLPTIRLA